MGKHRGTSLAHGPVCRAEGSFEKHGRTAGAKETGSIGHGHEVFPHPCPGNQNHWLGNCLRKRVGGWKEAGLD